MKVVWSRRAIRHLVRLREHIEKGSEQNAALVAGRILKAVALLESHPEIGRPFVLSSVRSPTHSITCRGQRVWYNWLSTWLTWPVLPGF